MGTTRVISKRFLRGFLFSFFAPLDYVRTVEIPILLEQSGILDERRPLRVLDLASPQILSLSLARQFPDWEIVYVNKYKPELDELLVRKHALRVHNLSAVEWDITTRMDFVKEFDYVLSCSVFEHITPEQGGDAAAAAILRDYLKDGGVFAFTVPFSKQAFSEYRTGNVYSHSDLGNEKVFFQRFYDAHSLESNIIRSSGLERVRSLFLGERFWFPERRDVRLAGFINSSSLVTLLLGRLYPLLSHTFMTRSKDWWELRKPYIAVVVLRKG